MSRPDSASGAQVVRLGVPHALRDERLSGMSAEDLIPYAAHVEARLGAPLGPCAAALWREAVTAPAYLSHAAPTYSQAGIALAMRAAHERSVGRARPAVASVADGDPVRAVVALLFPELHEDLEAEALDLARGRERWASARIDYPGIDPADLHGPAADLLMRGEPWERAYLSTLSRRAGIAELPLFVMEVFRRWKPDATDVRTVLPVLAWLGPGEMPRTEREWQDCRAAARGVPSVAR